MPPAWRTTVARNRSGCVVAGNGELEIEGLAELHVEVRLDEQALGRDVDRAAGAGSRAGAGDGDGQRGVHARVPAPAPLHAVGDLEAQPAALIAVRQRALESDELALVDEGQEHVVGALGQHGGVDPIGSSAAPDSITAMIVASKSTTR